MAQSREYQGFRDLIVYQKAYKLALEIFKITKFFPNEEKYSLTDQIRRSSRSVPVNLGEAWPKRRYVKAFVSKLIDCLVEASGKSGQLYASSFCETRNNRLGSG